MNARLRIARLALALALLGVGAGAADPVHAAEESAYERAQRYFEADTQLYRCIGQSILTRLIDAGETKHTIELAERYRAGDGVPRSPVQAFYWYSLAVLHGHEAELDRAHVEDAYNELTRLQYILVRSRLDRGTRLSCGHTYQE